MPQGAFLGRGPSSKALDQVIALLELLGVQGNALVRGLGRRTEAAQFAWVGIEGLAQVELGEPNGVGRQRSPDGSFYQGTSSPRPKCAKSHGEFPARDVIPRGLYSSTLQNPAIPLVTSGF
eukprot:6089635-Pleurochrysis_carterae.AAC.1